MVSPAPISARSASRPAPESALTKARSARRGDVPRRVDVPRRIEADIGLVEHEDRASTAVEDSVDVALEAAQVEVGVQRRDDEHLVDVGREHLGLHRGPSDASARARARANVCTMCEGRRRRQAWYQSPTVGSAARSAASCTEATADHREARAIRGLNVVPGRGGEDDTRGLHGILGTGELAPRRGVHPSPTRSGCFSCCKRRINERIEVSLHDGRALHSVRPRPSFGARRSTDRAQRRTSAHAPAIPRAGPPRSGTRRSIRTTRREHARPGQILEGARSRAHAPLRARGRRRGDVETSSAGRGGNDGGGAVGVRCVGTHDLTSAFGSRHHDATAPRILWTRADVKRSRLGPAVWPASTTRVRSALHATSARSRRGVPGRRTEPALGVQRARGEVRRMRRSGDERGPDGGARDVGRPRSR